MEPPSARTTCTPHPPVHSQLLSRLPRAKHFERDQHSLFSIIAALSSMQLEQKMSRLRGSGIKALCLGDNWLGYPAGITEEEKIFIYSGYTLINVVPEVKNRLFEKSCEIILKVFVLTLWWNRTSTVVQFLLFPLFHFIAKQIFKSDGVTINHPSYFYSFVFHSPVTHNITGTDFCYPNTAAPGAETIILVG